MKRKFFIFYMVLIVTNSYSNTIVYTSATGIYNFHKKIVNNQIKIFLRGVQGGTYPITGNNYTYNEVNSLVYIPYNGILNAYRIYPDPAVLTRTYFEISNNDSNMVLFHTFHPWAHIFYPPQWEKHHISYDYGIGYSELFYSANSGFQFKGFAIDPVNDSIVFIASRIKHDLFNNDTTYIYKSLNRGINFTVVDTIAIQVRNFYDKYIFLKINPFDNSELFLSGRNNLVVSNDSGESFTSSDLPPFLNINFNIADSLIIGFTSNQIYIKKYGADWELISQFNQRNFIRDVEIKDKHIFVASSKGIYKSNDFGKSFFLFNNAFNNTDSIMGISKLNTKDSLLVCTNKSLYLISDSSSLVSISSHDNDIVNSYNLYQNYPNPFNPATVIRYSILLDARRETQDVKLIVYDGLGKEVMTLVNENQNAGTYEVTFDGRGLSSGIYFYKLSAGDFVESKKMMFAK